MIRNRGPISTLGYNLTSRDLPTDEGESEGPSPNSGAIAKALNGHPVMRFFASAATALVALSSWFVIRESFLPSLINPIPSGIPTI